MLRFRMYINHCNTMLMTKFQHLVYSYCLATISRSSFVKGFIPIVPFLSSTIMEQNAKQDNDNETTLRILLHGGDNMLGRAVQLTFPVQAPGEELIKDSCTAKHYLDMCLNHDTAAAADDAAAREEDQKHLLGIEEIRLRNANRGSYLWGDYINMPIKPPPDLRVLNLETAVTKSINNDDVPRMKGINYHMHVDNYENIMSGFCQETHHGSTSDDDDDNNQQQQQQQLHPPSPVIVNCANNHGIDYGRTALEQETLPLIERLNTDKFQTIGLGKNIREVMKPATITCSGSSVPVQIFAFSAGCSGTPTDWWATETRSGLLGLPGIYSTKSVDTAMKTAIAAFEQSPKPQSTPSSSSLRIVSIHWGPNWAMKHEGEDQLEARRQFAHRLIDECGVDLIYGHSSHHARGIEVYKNKLILYGTGDIINDYEGFENPGEERYNRLGGIYLVDVDKSTGNFQQLRVIPMFMNRLRLERVTPSSAMWRPQQKRLERNPNKVQEFCTFLNQMSRMDAGSNGQALELEHYESDSQTPGGPILRSKSS